MYIYIYTTPIPPSKLLLPPSNTLCAPPPPPSSSPFTGDSDAILCRKGVPHMLSFQHKASDVSERQRIVAGGGTVYMNFGSWRVSGMLEVHPLPRTRTRSPLLVLHLTVL
jgi:hypothetical protein